MRKTLLALAVVLMLAPMASAQQAGGPSPHAIDFEALYYAAQLSGGNVWLATTADRVGEPVEEIFAKNQAAGSFIVRGVYRYKRELGIGGQYYRIAGTADVDETPANGFVDVLIPAPAAPTTTVAAETDISISALDLYHVQNVATTSESNYDLIGGFRWANTASNMEITGSERATPSSTTFNSTVTGKLFGPHIGITGKRGFLVEPLSVTGALSVSLLRDTSRGTSETTTDIAGVVTGVDDPTYIVTEPVQVIEGEIALRFTSTRMAGMGGSIGYLASQWENVGLTTGRGDIGVSGWRAGINFTY